MSDFRLGDIVETIKGAKFWGEIIAIDNDGNSPGCTVLAVDPGFAGTKHVYPLKQLAHRAPSPSPAPGVVEELLSDLATRPIIDGINYRALIRDFQERALRALSQPAKGELPDRDTSKPAEQQGLFRKFEVRRTDGSDQPGGKHHGCRYFVLDVDHDPYAIVALSAYAGACESTHPALSQDLREKWGARSSGKNSLLTRLRQYEGHQSETTACYNGLRDEAADAIIFLAALSAPSTPEGWRDMDSAPKDGAEFLAALSNGWVEILSGNESIRDNWRYSWWTARGRISIPYEPTHPADTDWSATSTIRAIGWMPLPSAPAGGSGNE